MATNKLQWKRIAMGDKLPCQSFLRKKDGEILKLSTIGGVTVGQDCYYLPVDEVINVIKDYPVEESEDERIINNIRKVIGWQRGMFTEKSLMPEQYQEIDAWLDKKGERKHQYKSRPRYVGEVELLGKKESTVFSGDENIRKALVEMVHDTVGDSLWVDYNVHKEDAIAWLEKQCEHAKFRDSIQVGDKVTRNQDGVLVNLSQLNRVAKKDEKQGEHKPILDVEIPFGAKDSELEEVTYDIPKGYHAEIEDNKVVIKKDKQKIVKCMFSNDNYTDEERKVLCDGCKVECELKRNLELSKEDKDMLGMLLEMINYASDHYQHDDKATDIKAWVLKSLRQKLSNVERIGKNWKPSDEQMYNLSEAAHCKSAFFDCNILIGLYDELKKLREE